jgi:hypothetical protein
MENGTPATILVAAKRRRGSVIGNDVWIGYQALVLPGVTIGHGAVVAAASVVVGDVDPHTVVAGNPARVVRRRFDDENVTRLLRAAWWDWPVDLVTQQARVIMAGEPAQLEQLATRKACFRPDIARSPTRRPNVNCRQTAVIADTVRASRRQPGQRKRSFIASKQRWSSSRGLQQR